MVKKLPPLNSLKAFECSARHLSFTKAAEELNVTQAAISHHIKILEDFLGVSLFYRRSRLLQLTEIGKNYYDEVSSVFNQLIDATNNLLEYRNEKRLSLAVPTTFITQWLVPHLSDFNEQYPDVELNLNGVEQDENFFKPNETDVAIYYGTGGWKGYQFDKLFDSQMVILASPNLLAKKPINRPEDLIKHKIIHINNYQNWQSMVSSLGLTDFGIHQGTVFSHTLPALQAAILGQGLILANKMLAKKEIESGFLQVVLPEKSMSDPKSFYLVHKLDKSNFEEVMDFKQWLLTTIHNEIYG